MEPKEIRRQIQSIKTKAQEDIIALEKQLSLSTSGYSVGDTLESTVNGGHTFKVTGSTPEGLKGTLSKPFTITPDRYRLWKLAR